ncbi:myeloid-associated differentiation marker-like protein 2 [Puntigrus tetrazona]|uniref:myeloid-associated differentiation marker-like protein 2 n=1 Tax=Puntigrus tetrazona TaxID=1606681 RepID=UPI001C8B04F5|nr:myeloid-associated differentiation marker-like protein 2 [Puntigrus tetrazona]
MSCGLSLNQTSRILEVIFCALSLIISIFRGPMYSPYGIWCEFVWVFGLIVAVVIFVVEKCLVDKLIELLVLKHSWNDLSCGLSLLSSLMLLSACLIYCAKFVCAICVVDIICAIASILALAAYVVDAVMLKLKCPAGYLSNLRGILRFSQAFVACLIFTAVYSYFKGVENQFRPGGMIWCIVVYVVCFPPTVMVIPSHLQKCVDLLRCCDLNKLELVLDIVAVALYVSAAIIWPVFGYKHYRRDSKTNDYRFHDLNLVTTMTYVNLGLYLADLVWTLIVICKKR